MLTEKRLLLLFLFPNNIIHKLNKFRNITLIVLVFGVLVALINASDNGGLVLFAHAQPFNITKTPTKEIPLAGTAVLNVITKIKNLYTFGGIGVDSNGSRSPEIVPSEGSLTPKDFTYRLVNDIGDSLAEPFPGKPTESGKGQIIRITPGFYRVIFESPLFSPYITEMSPDCSGTLMTKEVRECVITHTFVGTKTLRVITEVDNTGGGAAKAEDFTMLIDGGTPHEATGKLSPGQEITLFPSALEITSPKSYFYSYEIRPKNVYGHPYDFPGYLVKASGIWCELYKTHSIPESVDTPECTFTYKFVGKATLNVTTTIDNTGGGSLVAESLEHTIQNNGIYLSEDRGDSSGKEYEISAGSYQAIAETAAGYSHTESKGCFGIVSPGEKKDCQITYTFLRP